MSITTTSKQLKDLEDWENPEIRRMLLNKWIEKERDDSIRKLFKRAHRRQQIKDWIVAITILMGMLTFINIVWQA